MLHSKDAIADVVEVLREADFYRPAHAVVYSAILDLYGRASRPTPSPSRLTWRARGSSAGGGAPYLHTLVSMVFPRRHNAGYDGRIVREQAILRRLVEAGTRIVSMGYTGTGHVHQMVDRAQAEVYDVTDRRTSENYAPLSDINRDALNEIEAAGSYRRWRDAQACPTGFTELDKLTNGLHPGQLIIVAARPAIGKSTLGVDIARASIHQARSRRAFIFSLEMSRNEIVMRLLSAEAQVPLHRMRSGTIGRRRLEQARQQDGHGQRGAAVHRRLRRT